MSTLTDLVADVAERADADPAHLSHLTVVERPAYLAGLAERAWRRVGCFGAGVLVGLCICVLAGCGGGGTDADGKPDTDMTIDPPHCASSGACT